MIAVVSLSLLLVGAVVGCIVVAMFLDVAFKGPDSALEFASGPGRSRAPMLFSKFDGAGLARRVEQVVSRTLAQLGATPTAAPTCDATCFQRKIEVTVPEVLAIVDELRDGRTPAQVASIRFQAGRNLESRAEEQRCPLLLSGGFCACESARPVSCLTRCIAGGDSPAEAQRVASTVEAGVTEIFRDCLHATGLDDARYELNSALTQLLDQPTAARRWARGDHVLHN